MKRMLVALAAFNSFVVSNPVFAQSWCDSQDLSCQRRNDVQRQDEQIIRNNENPDDYGSSQPRIVYLPPKASQYGAVALNLKTGTLGTATKQASSSLANRVALADCGQKGCKIISSYSNSCMAYAYGASGHSFLRGELSIEESEKSALSACSESESDCKIFISECSLP